MIASSISGARAGVSLRTSIWSRHDLFCHRITTRHISPLAFRLALLASRWIGSAGSRLLLCWRIDADHELLKGSG